MDGAPVKALADGWDAPPIRLQGPHGVEAGGSNVSVLQNLLWVSVRTLQELSTAPLISEPHWVSA